MNWDEIDEKYKFRFYIKDDNYGSISIHDSKFQNKIGSLYVDTHPIYSYHDYSKCDDIIKQYLRNEKINKILN